MRAALLLALLALGTSAAAQPRPARDTADVGAAGSYSVGLFNPLRIAVHDRVELEAHPLVFFVAPHLTMRVAVLKPTDQAGVPTPGPRLTYELGLAWPTWAMSFTKGYLFPSWATSSNHVGAMLIPRMGLLLSGDALAHDVYTVRADVSVRWPMGRNSAEPLDAPLAPLNLLLAAPLTGFLGRVGAAYDHAFNDRLRLRGEANLFLTGWGVPLLVSDVNMGPVGATSPLIVTAHVGLDIAVFRASRVTVGLLYANFDNGATQVVTDADGFSERIRVRSHNVLPTIDFIWAGP